jgi:acetyl-CoA synthetase
MHRDKDGYFWYVGRADDVFKSSGYRIGPFEIESVLVEHDAVLGAFTSFCTRRAAVLM